jgi:hypothetical protein
VVLDQNKGFHQGKGVFSLDDGNICIRHSVECCSKLRKGYVCVCICVGKGGRKGGRDRGHPCRIGNA